MTDRELGGGDGNVTSGWDLRTAHSTEGQDPLPADPCPGATRITASLQAECGHVHSLRRQLPDSEQERPWELVLIWVPPH